MAKNSWPEIGNRQAIDFLKKGLKNDKIAQAYVFAGPDDLGKSTVALAFAHNLQGGTTENSFDSDLSVLQPEEGKKNISIEAVRGFIKEMSLGTFAGRFRIGIIKKADFLSIEAKNALLKTLEEPNPGAVIILLVSSEDNLPKTIISRCQVLNFYPVASSIIYDYLIKEKGANRSLAKDISNISLGRPLVAVKYLEDQEAYRAYLDKAAAWLEIPKLDLFSRFRLIDKLLGGQSWSEEAYNEAKTAIAMTEGLSRDLVMLSLGEKERLQHSALLGTLEDVLAFLDKRSNGNPRSLLASYLKLCVQAKEYLEANVNPRLILEHIVINM
jgi:DNA polymerase-3 subunit delta'